MDQKLKLKKSVNEIPEGFSNSGGLELIDPNDTLEIWNEKKAKFQKNWLDFLGSMPFPRFKPSVREEEWQEHKYFNGRLVYVQTEPEYFEKTYLLVPKELKKKHPAIIVYYYDIDTMIGEDMGGARFLDTPNRFFALELVKRGYVVQVMRWFYQGYKNNDYTLGVERMSKVYPGVKGLSKVISDSSFVLDYLTNLSYVDKDRIGAIGHSLGGKMGLYCAAFDERIKASVLSELGIGLTFCNWDAPWYLGEEIRNERFDLDHHQLLGLIAPRPLLLLAGDSADSNKSWYYVNAAKQVYSLYDAKDDIGLFNHHSGHDPEKNAMELAYNWLDSYLRF